MAGDTPPRTDTKLRTASDQVATWGEDGPEGRWRSFAREQLLARDKASLDLFWLKDKSLTDLDNLPDPDEMAEEIIEGLEAGLASLRSVLGELRGVGAYIRLRKSAGFLGIKPWQRFSSFR